MRETEARNTACSDHIMVLYLPNLSARIPQTKTPIMLPRKNTVWAILGKKALPHTRSHLRSHEKDAKKMKIAKNSIKVCFFLSPLEDGVLEVCLVVFPRRGALDRSRDFIRSLH